MSLGNILARWFRKKPGVTLFIAADGPFAEHALPLLHSALSRCSRPVETFLLTDAAPALRARVARLHQAYGARLNLLPADEVLRADAHRPEHRRFRNALYARLFVTEFIPPRVRRLIYLDTDTLVRKDLAPLVDLPLDGAPIAAADCHSAIKRAEFLARFGGRYFNAGVLVMDMERIRRERRFAPERVLATCLGEAGPLHWRDQCVINHLCPDWKHMGITWNFSQQVGPRFAHRFGLSRAAFEAIAEDPGVFHFIGPAKPWTIAWPEADRFAAEWHAHARACAALLNGTA